MRDVSTNCRFAPKFGSMRSQVNLVRGVIIVPVIVPGNVAVEAADGEVLSDGVGK